MLNTIDLHSKANIQKTFQTNKTNYFNYVVGDWDLEIKENL